MTSTTEIASNVVEELDKSNLRCDKKGRRTVRKQDRTLLKEAMGKQNNS
jgi:histone H3/H4